MLEIADHLGAGRFGVLGISAGAKFALATGLELPDRVTAVVLASAFGPLGAGGMPATLANNALPRVRATLWFYRRAAQVAPWLSGAVSALAAFVMKQSTDGLIRFGRYLTPRTEREVFGHPEVRKVAVETFRCSAAQGGAGMEKEFQLIVEPWGLALDQLRVPVVLFHGIEDRVAPFGMATALAKQIPGARLEPKENCGHVSLLVKHATEILEPL